MDFLTAESLPYLFLAISLLFFLLYVAGRIRFRNATPITQRNRLRMGVIFAIVGVGHLLWRYLG